MKKQGKPRSSGAKPSVKRSPPEIRWEKVVYSLFERIVQDHPWSGNPESVKGAIRARNWEAVLKAVKARPPQMYADEHQYYADCQVEHIFKKLPIPGSEVAAEKAAWDTFVADEKRNRRTNQYFAIWQARDFRHKNLLYTRLIGRMQSFIASVLGPRPDFSAIYECCDFGPGSSVGVGGDSTHPYAKLDRLTASPKAIPYVLGAYWSNSQIREMYCNHRLVNGSFVACIDPSYFHEQFMEVVEYADYNKIDFVLKNYHTKRMTASEPIGNAYVQIGAGVDIANRLRQFRPFLNIWDQSRNQRLARAGSMCDARVPYATLDMKSASQSLTRNMVRSVLAHVPEWFDLLDSIRSPNFTSNYGNGRYQLFMSMGNGFCFPLQTMIFAAAVEAVYAETGGSTYGVYGDDIIVDPSSALLLMEWLKVLGVRTNRDKSFVFGPFRESCGADFFNGVNVRPYVLDFIPERGRDLVKIANGISYRAARPSWSAWWGLWNMLPAYCRKTVRPFAGPDDTGITVPVSFYELHKLDEYDSDLQRSRIRSFKTMSIADDSSYISKNHSSGQALLALRGATPKQQEKVRRGRDSPLSFFPHGTPTPSYRRQTRSYLVSS